MKDEYFLFSSLSLKLFTSICKIQKKGRPLLEAAAPSIFCCSNADREPSAETKKNPD